MTWLWILGIVVGVIVGMVIGALLVSHVLAKMFWR